MTKAEIITDTVTYYEEDPSRRAYSDQLGYQYQTEDGRRCAIGRYLANPGDITNMRTVAHILKSRDFHLFRKDVRQHTEWEFWQNLQLYHDCWPAVDTRRQWITDLWGTYCPEEPMPEFAFYGDNHVSAHGA